MKRFSVRGLRCAMSFASKMPRSVQAGHVPTTTSGSLLVAHSGSMHTTRGFARNALTFTCGMPQVGQSSSCDSILPFGSGYVTSQSGHPAQPMNMEWVLFDARICKSLPHLGHFPT